MCVHSHVIHQQEGRESLATVTIPWLEQERQEASAWRAVDATEPGMFQLAMSLPGLLD